MSNLQMLIFAVLFGTVLGTPESTAQDTVASLWTRARGQDWPEFLGVNRDSKSDESGILKDWTDGRLKVVWTYPLSESYGIGSISKGRLLQFDRVDDRQVLICLNAETGEKIWSKSYKTDYRDLYGYNGGPRSSPTIDGDRVYTLGVQGELRCWKLGDGELVWRVDTNQRFGVIQNFFGVGSSPVIHQDLVICMVGGSPAESKSVPPGRLDLVKGNGSGVVAFDKRTGKVRYQLSDELASYSSPVIKRIGKRDWGFLFARGGLIGFDPVKGKQLDFYAWRDNSLESVNASNPVIVDDQVFISETYGPGSSLLAANPDGFDVIWKDKERSRVRAMQTHWNTAIHHKGFLYGSSGRHTSNAELKCIDWKTGEEKWSMPGLTRCSLLYADDHFVSLSETGVLFLLKANPEKFELVTSLRLNQKQNASSKDVLLKYPCWSAPILSHGLLFVRGDDKLVCLDLIPKQAN